MRKKSDNKTVPVYCFDHGKKLEKDMVCRDEQGIDVFYKCPVDGCDVSYVVSTPERKLQNYSNNKRTPPGWMEIPEWQ